MEITFSNSRIEKILTNKRLIKKEYGILTNNIISRITELQSAKSLAEISHLPPPRRHKLVGFDARYAIDLSKNYRLIIEAKDKSIVDLDKITKIVILGILDYH